MASTGWLSTFGQSCVPTTRGAPTPSPSNPARPMDKPLSPATDPPVQPP